MMMMMALAYHQIKHHRPTTVLLRNVHTYFYTHLKESYVYLSSSLAPIDRKKEEFSKVHENVSNETLLCCVNVKEIYLCDVIKGGGAYVLIFSPEFIYYTHSLPTPCIKQTMGDTFHFIIINITKKWC